MKRSLWLLSGLVLPALALAGHPPIQESMVVTGTITVNPDGGVAGYSLYRPDKLPPGVRELLQKNVPRLQFVPIMQGGKAISARAGMSLRIVADQIDAKHMSVRFAGAAFGCAAGRARKLLPGACPAGTTVSYVESKPPMYPVFAARAGVGGKVFLVVRIGRDGHVAQAAVRQVNLYRLTDNQAFFRKMLADASLRAARKWRFRIPTVGPSAGKDHWVVTIPINFMMRGSYAGTEGREYGHWNIYLPGPVTRVPWAAENTRGGSGGADAIAGNAPFVRDSRFVLKTQLSNGAGQS